MSSPRGRGQSKRAESQNKLVKLTAVRSCPAILDRQNGWPASLFTWRSQPESLRVGHLFLDAIHQKPFRKHGYGPENAWMETACSLSKRPSMLAFKIVEAPTKMDIVLMLPPNFMAS